MSTKYWFIRHGEADHNVQGVLNDETWVDSNLTEKGIEQAKHARYVYTINGGKFDVVYCSPFDRCIQTCNIVLMDGEIPHDIILDERLGERMSGMSGQPARNFYNEYGNLLNPVKEGTESFYNILSRVSDFIQETRTLGYKNILCVTHGDVMRAARCIFNMTSPFDELMNRTPKNCDIMTFDLPKSLPKRS